jgi:hypothetical protein
MPYYHYNIGEILLNFSALLLISRFETTSCLAAAILNFLSQKNSQPTKCVAGYVYWSKLSKSALAFDDSLHFGEVYHEYRILSEISVKLPCFGRQFGLVGGAKRKFFCRFVDNSYTDKVTKAFPRIPIGYDAAAKRSAWGVILPPGHQEG